MLFHGGTRHCLIYQGLLYATNKDVLPALQKRNMIYQFSCQRDSWYVGVPPKDGRTELNITFPNLPILAILRNVYFQPVGANLLPRLIILSLLLPIQPLNFTFCKILTVLNIMMTADFLFLTKAKAALLFIYLLLKPLLSQLLSPPSTDKKNSFTA